MNKKWGDDAFFIGWSPKIDLGLARFLATCAAGLLGFVFLASFGLSAFMRDPAVVLFSTLPGASSVQTPEPWMDSPTLRGVVTMNPYPVVHVAPDADHPAGRSLLLSGDGKRGVDVPASLNPIEFEGARLLRGTIEMLVVDTPPKILSAAPSTSAPTPIALGRWRVVGEICDGKCYAGAMRPGSGLAHRACANLCLIGDVPAVFVAATPAAGAEFFLLADADGLKPNDALRAFTGQPVEIEGNIERLGAIHIFKVDRVRGL